MPLRRYSDFLYVTIPLGTALSDPIDMRVWAGAALHMPAGWDAADIAFTASLTVDGTYNPVYDPSGSLVEISGPAADQVQEVPSEIYERRFVKLWSESAGVGVNQTAARVIGVERKS